MEEKKEKRVLQVELDDDVKKVSITGKNGDDQVVMSQELDEDDLDQVAGGYNPRLPYYQYVKTFIEPAKPYMKLLGLQKLSG